METTYVFSGKFAREVNRHAELVSSHLEVDCKIHKFLKGKSDEYFLVAISGPDDERSKACGTFEWLFDELKNDELNTVSERDGFLKAYTTEDYFMRHKEFVNFSGYVLYIDPVYEGLMATLRKEIDMIALALNVEIYTKPNIRVP